MPHSIPDESSPLQRLQWQLEEQESTLQQQKFPKTMRIEQSVHELYQIYHVIDSKEEEKICHKSQITCTPVVKMGKWEEKKTCKKSKSELFVHDFLIGSVRKCSSPLISTEHPNSGDEIRSESNSPYNNHHRNECSTIRRQWLNKLSPCLLMWWPSSGASPQPTLQCNRNKR